MAKFKVRLREKSWSAYNDWGEISGNFYKGEIPVMHSCIWKCGDLMTNRLIPDEVFAEVKRMRRLLVLARRKLRRA